MIKGSCLCKAVTYSINGVLGPISHCHCKTCQKSHAAAFATVARAKKSEFKITSGERSLTGYKTSPHKVRYFCTKCGSQIYADYEGHEEVVIMLGTLDSDPGARPIRHIFVSEKASWYEMDKDLRKFDGWPDA